MADLAMTYAIAKNLTTNSFTKTGYTFTGWNTKADGTGTNYSDKQSVNNLTNVNNGTITLFAKWEENTYFIIIDKQDGTIPSTITTAYKTATTIENPSKTGYTFTGWTITGMDNTTHTYGGQTTTSTSLTGITATSFKKLTSVNDGEVTFEATWSPITYTINYSLNGGTVGTTNPGNYTIESNNIILNEPTKSGYAFTGWTGSNGNTPQKTVTIEHGSTGNKNYTANYSANTYEVKLDNNGGTGTMTNQSFTYGTSQALSLNTFNKENYKFAGWNTKADGTGTSYSNKQSVNNLTTVNNGIVTLYAMWTENEKYIITYKTGDGENNEDNPLYYQTGQEITLNAPTKTGYKFMGWYKDEDYNIPINKITSDMHEDITLYAKWQINKVYIKMNMNGGSLSENHGDDIGTSENNITVNNSINVYTLNYGSRLDDDGLYNYNNDNYINIKKNGYIAINEKEWKKLDGTTYNQTISYAASDFCDAKENDCTVELFVNWTVENYHINYDLNGGTVNTANPENYTVETPSITLNNPSKEGYVFTGWTGTGLENKTKNVTIEHGSTGNRNYVANYSTNNYTIHFDTNGGSEIADIDKEYGEEVLKPANPTKSGYRFAGWYSDNEFTNSYIFTTMPNHDITLYAKWEVITYNITYYLNGGTVNAANPGNYTVETPSITLNNPSKEGSVFTGWTGTGLEEKTKTVTIEHGSTGNRSYVANYSTNSHTIHFNSNGGSEIADIDKVFGEEVFKPANPTKSGYKFKGWYTDQECTNEYTFSTMPDYNIILYAKWEIIVYNITYDLNDGSLTAENPYNYTVESESITLNNPSKEGSAFTGWTGTGLEEKTKTVTIEHGSTGNRNYVANYSMNSYTIYFNSNGGSTVEEIDAQYNEEITAPEEPTKEGYTFKGWYTDQECTNKYVFNKMPNHNITLYAGWDKNTYTVSFNTNGGTELMPILVEQQDKVVSPSDPTKTGYTFKGWYTDQGLINLYDFNTEITSNITLYAKWEKNKYTVHYNTNGGNIIEDEEVYYGDAVPRPQDPVRDGYTFKGWLNEGLGEYEFGTMPNYNLNLQAKWQVNKYKITFDSNGGSTVNQIESEYGKKLTEPNAPTKEGYKFAGWYLDEELTNLYSFTTMPNENIIVYAKWTSNEKVISYRNLEGGKLDEDSPTTYLVGQEVILKAATKEGYTFKGWYLDSNYTTPINKITSDMNENIIVYAKWQINQYTISINSTGGNEIEEITKNYNDEVMEPTEPTKEGYKFAGWYLDEELTKLYSFTTMPSQNITLYTKWADEENVIHYVTNGGYNDEDNPTTYTEGSEITLNAPTKEDFVFVGWYLDSEYTTPTNKITSDMNEDITLYARWEKQVYTISFDSNGGTYVDEILATYQEKIETPTSPTKQGYKFIGWYSDKNLTRPYTFNTMPNKNIVLYAKWTENNKNVITFDTNGGSTVNKIIAEANKVIYEPNDPYKEGYKFAGWYLDENLTRLYSFTTMPSTDITLYAKWANNDTNVIRYVTNGGYNDEKNPTTYLTGDVLYLNAPTKENYVFMGWYLDENYQTQIDTITRDMDSDLRLYAKWEKVMRVEVPYTNKNIPILIVLGSLLLIITSIYGTCKILGINIKEEILKNIKKIKEYFSNNDNE